LQRVPILLAALLATPSFAQAQGGIGIDKLLDRIENLSIYYSRGGIEPESQAVSAKSRDGVVGYGIELGFLIGEYPKKVAAEAGSKAAKNIVASDDPKISFSIGLGYGEMAHFRAKNSTISIHGSVWELPALAIYSAFRPEKILRPYMSLRSGLAQLRNMSVFSTTETVSTRHKMEGTTFQCGGAVGLTIDLGREINRLPKVDLPRSGIGLFVETAYTYRNFRGIHYSEAKAPPSAAPSSLNFSVWDASIGLQFDLGKKKQ